MKTSSILMSSFAALLILISVNENALKRNEEVSKPDQTISGVQPIAVINEMPAVASAPSAPPVSINVKTFSYLKFEVSDFETSGSAIDEMPEQADFAYLEFNVSDFTETETEVVLLPENQEFDYLKFDSNDYTAYPYDEEYLPSAGFDYLKFDVKKFIQNDSLAEISELPDPDNQ